MLGAIAEIGRQLVPAERFGAAEQQLHPFALAPVVRRVGLLGVLRDLAFGERTRQTLPLLVHRQLGVEPAGRRDGLEAADGVALPIAAVAPITLGVLVRGIQAAA